MKQSETTLLSPSRFTEAISRNRKFMEELPKRDFNTLSGDEQRQVKRRAIGRGALAVSEQLKEEKTPDSGLDSHLFKLVGNLDAFFGDSRRVKQTREKYEDVRQMSQRERNTFEQRKQGVIDFNHALYDVIDAGASRFDFNQLLEFMTKMHIAANSRESAKEFYTYAREALIGMRAEAVFGQALIAGGRTFKRDKKLDKFGGDFTVDDVPIDVKASEFGVEEARRKAERDGRNPDTIIWLHMNFEDFDGKLALSPDKAAELYQRIEPDLDNAIASEREPAYAE